MNEELAELKSLIVSLQNDNKAQKDRIGNLEKDTKVPAQPSTSNGSQSEVATLKAKLKKADEVYRTLQTSYRKLAASGGGGGGGGADAAKLLALQNENRELKTRLTAELTASEQLRSDLRQAERTLVELETKLNAEADKGTSTLRDLAGRIAMLEAGRPTGARNGGPVIKSAPEDDDEIVMLE